MRASSRSVAILLLSVFVLTVVPSVVVGAGVPKFYVSKTTVDLGEVLEGSDVVYNFVIQNHGDAELQILSVRPG